ncbi:MAG: phosphodiester glycosidase family protein [Candidatus Sumerlaeia bacterium]|nr:phosphodiester glycosidase family protein [Candidatus Sumerlaeia bacterium]
MAFWRTATALLAILLLLAAGAPAQTPLGPGAQWREYSLPGPVRAFVVSFERARPDFDLVMGFPFERRSSQTKEIPSAIATRYHRPPEFDVLAAVNASFFGSGNDIIGNLASEANYLQWPDLSRSWPAFAWFDTGSFAIATRPTITDNQARFADGSSIGIDLLNEDRLTNTLVVYTPTWGATTTTIAQAVEVIVSGVNYPMRVGKTMSGTITAVRTGAASVNNAIPAGGAVLSARDGKGTTLLEKAKVGERVTWRAGLSQSIWNNMRLAVDGAGWILRDGAANTSAWSGFSDDFKGRHPRTMLAWNATHGFLIAVDGRQSGYSVGMTFQEMADFCRDVVGATDAINLDGGGSTAMVAGGSLVNRPSDGAQRAVPNVVMLVRRGGPRAKTLVDSFPAGGRQLAWDDKFTANLVEPFAPTAPGGDGHVMVVMDPAGGFEVARVGERSDGNCVVEASLYCDYRPGDAGDGHERIGLFARDQGQGAFVATSFGGGNSYVMTYDSDDGRIRMGKVVNGVLTDFRDGSRLFARSTAWRRFRIVCRDTTIEYYLDGGLVHSQQDATFAAGTAGVGYHEFFANNANMRGARVENFEYRAQSVFHATKDAWLLK